MLFLATIYLIIPAVQVFWFVVGQPFFNATDFLDYLAAILMFHWMMNGVLLSAKIPAMQRYLPYDQRIRWHIVGNIAVIGLFLYHVASKLLLGKDIDPVSWSLLAIFTSMTIVTLIWIPLPLISQARTWLISHVRPTILRSYDALKKLHNVLFLVLAGFMYWHILLVKVFDQVPLVSIVLYNLIFFAALTSYAFAWIRLLFLPRVRVTAIHQSGGVTTIRFGSKRPLRYRAGQFAFLHFDHSLLRGENHPFSFLSSPEDAQIAFGVKILGDFTAALTNLKVGDTARINAGFGNFRLTKEPEPVFIGSGIGAVPFISLLKDLHARGDQRSIRFHLAVNTAAEIPEAETLTKIRAEMPNLTMDLLINQTDKRVYSYEYFRDHLKEPQRHTYFICSSPKVRGIIIDALKRLGVKKNAIRYENFSFS